MRSLVDARKAEMYAAQTDAEWVELLVFQHADLAATIRLVNAETDVVSRSDTYTAYAFTAELPGQDDKTFPGAAVVLDNVDVDLLSQLRALTGDPPTVTIEVVVLSAPDAVVVGPWNLELSQIQFGVLPLNATLGHEPILDEPYPGLTYNPTDFPGMFE